MIFLLITVRVVRKYRIKNIVKRKGRDFVLEDATVDVCCCLGQICFVCADAEASGVDPADKQVEAHERKRAQAYTETRGDRLTEEELQIRAYTDEAATIKELIQEKRETKLTWLSTVTTIPIEKIIKIVDEDPDLVIENECVINTKVEKE
jgi:hypothetical protein